MDRTDRSAEPIAAATASPGASPPHPAGTLAACILASSLAFVDGSVVNVALPAIGQGLQAGPAGLQWVVNAYLLPLSALLLAGGAVGDLYGRRRMLITGVAVFALASVLCALAPSLGLLLAGRVLQGAAAALLRWTRARRCRSLRWSARSRTQQTTQTQLSRSTRHAGDGRRGVGEGEG